jgi:hypothetical protein
MTTVSYATSTPHVPNALIEVQIDSLSEPPEAPLAQDCTLQLLPFESGAEVLHQHAHLAAGYLKKLAWPAFTDDYR